MTVVCVAIKRMRDAAERRWLKFRDMIQDVLMQVARCYTTTRNTMGMKHSR